MLRYFDDVRTDESRAFQVYLYLIGCAHARKIVTYGIVADVLGFRGAGVLDKILGHIMFWCDEHEDLPSLTCIVVNKKTGLPGPGLIDVDDLNAEREKVYDFNWFGLYPPTVEELDQAYKNGIESQ